MHLPRSQRSRLTREEQTFPGVRNVFRAKTCAQDALLTSLSMSALVAERPTSITTTADASLPELYQRT